MRGFVCVERKTRYARLRYRDEKADKSERTSLQSEETSSVHILFLSSQLNPWLTSTKYSKFKRLPTTMKSRKRTCPFRSTLFVERYLSSSYSSYRRLALKVSPFEAHLTRCSSMFSSGIRIRILPTKLRRRKNSNWSPKRTKSYPTVGWIILILLVLLVFFVWHSTSLHQSSLPSVLSDGKNASLIMLVSLDRWSMCISMSIKLCHDRARHRTRDAD